MSSSPEVDQLLRLCAVHLKDTISVEPYEFTSCYLWHDSPLYNEFGEKIRDLRGDTIYLYNQSAMPQTDLFHELGHLVGRKLNMVGHTENSFQGIWDSNNQKLIAQVKQRTHWSGYLNLFALNQENFIANAASELWAELFMLWHLQPALPEARLLDSTMVSLQPLPMFAGIQSLASAIRLVDSGT